GWRCAEQARRGRLERGEHAEPAHCARVVVTRVPASDFEAERCEVPRRRVQAPVLLHPGLIEPAAIVSDADHLVQIRYISVPVRIEAGLVEERAARQPRAPFTIEREPKLPSTRIGDARLAVLARVRRPKTYVVAKPDCVERELVLRAECRRHVNE